MKTFGNNKTSVTIRVTHNGPYEVYGTEEIGLETITPDEDGASWEYRKGKQYKNTEDGPMSLCRCGHSKHAPFCDGSHEQVDWDGEETAPFIPIKAGAEVFEGPNLRLLDNQNYCAYARFCDAKGRIWNLAGVGTEETDNLAVREAFHCPAGRLMMEKQDGTELEPEFEPTISALEDPVIGCSGPLWVKGGIPVQSADGKGYEVRNRQTLCRCGLSSNKPFCDGSHATAHYNAQYEE